MKTIHSLVKLQQGQINYKRIEQTLQKYKQSISIGDYARAQTHLTQHRRECAELPQNHQLWIDAENNQALLNYIVKGCQGSLDMSVDNHPAFPNRRPDSHRGNKIFIESER